MSDYHGPKPVTDSDKKMAKKHLKLTHDLLEDQHDLLEDKIDDHKKAMKDAIKAGNKKSASYNKGHYTKHEDEQTDIDKKEKSVKTSMQTLSKLATPKTYDDVRKKKVAIMDKKASNDY